MLRALPLPSIRISIMAALSLAVAPTLHAQVAAAASDAAATLATCAGCHGAAGEGQPQGGFPRIAGQSADYLRAQLDAYADGRRRNAVMEPIAKGLTPAQRDAAARHYAMLAPGPAGAASAPSKQAVARGALIAARGDESLGVQACANCHGPEGAGAPGQAPYLAGQNGGYFNATMTAWQNGARRTDPSNQMPHIARALHADDLFALAAYFESLAAPAALDRQRRVAWRSDGRAIRSGPTPAAQAQPSTGTGVEQGTPTTGGGVGPGGGGVNANGPGATPASGAQR